MGWTIGLSLMLVIALLARALDEALGRWQRKQLVRRRLAAVRAARRGRR